MSFLECKLDYATFVLRNLQWLLTKLLTHKLLPVQTKVSFLLGSWVSSKHAADDAHFTGPSQCFVEGNGRSFVNHSSLSLSGTLRVGSVVFVPSVFPRMWHSTTDPCDPCGMNIWTFTCRKGLLCSKQEHKPFALTPCHTLALESGGRPGYQFTTEPFSGSWFAKK